MRGAGRPCRGDERAVEIEAGQQRRIGRELQAQAVPLRARGGELECAGEVLRRAPAAGALERPGERVGLRVEVDGGDFEPGAPGRIGDDERAVAQRDALELHAIVGRGFRQGDRAIGADGELEPRPADLDIAELQGAPQQRADSQLENRALSRDPRRPGNRVRQMHIIELEPGGRQQRDVDVAGDAHRRAQRVGEALLHPRALGPPVDKMRADERHREAGDQQRGQNGEDFAQDESTGSSFRRLSYSTFGQHRGAERCGNDAAIAPSSRDAMEPNHSAPSTLNGTTRLVKGRSPCE